jgi:adenine-specific DNA-methyltransferase
MIEGDNLEVLKLLQKSYAGKVKLIYIDPPYNTGGDFVYPDDFRDNIKNYLELTGQIEGDRKLSSNTEASGRFHTDWLSMMYPRLKTAKTLLHLSGAILVSINDSEAPKLRLMMDDIFGEENFKSQIVWQRSKKGDAKHIVNSHEYILCYVRDKEQSIASGPWRRKKDGAEDVLTQYATFKSQFGGNHERLREAMMEWYRSLKDGDPRKSHKHYNWSDQRGLYFAADFAGPDDGRASRPRHNIMHPVTGKPCKKPSTGWRWDLDKTQWALEQDPPRIHFGPDETTIPTRKSYLAEISSEPYVSVLYRDGRSATLEVESLVGKGVFPFPKNTDVLAELIELLTGPNDLILDFFAGSGSTGHAVLNVNVMHNTRRRYLLVQLQEPTRTKKANGEWEETAASKAGFATIVDITTQRLRNAAKVIKKDHSEYLGDLGFRVFKLDASNIRGWQPDRNNLAATLEDPVEHLRNDRTEQDVLYELLLKLGLDLCVPIEKKRFTGKIVHSIGGGVLIACLTEKIVRKEVEALGLGIVEWRKALAPAGDTTCVFRDSAFSDDVVKTNLAAILEQNGIANVRSL